MKLEWCKPKEAEGTLFYEVYRKSQDKPLVGGDIMPENMIGKMGSDGGCLVFFDPAVKAGKSYGYAVIVVDDGGNRSEISTGDAPVAVMQ